MIEVHLDGKQLQIPEGSRLSDLLPDRDPGCSVAVIKPVLEEETESQEVRLATSVGDIIIEVADPGLVPRLLRPDIAEEPDCTGRTATPQPLDRLSPECGRHGNRAATSGATSSSDAAATTQPGPT